MQNNSTSPDFQVLFESVPGLYLVLTPDLEIVAVSNAYLSATMTKREDITGKGLFEVFPDNPNDPSATGVNNLKASLNRVIHNKTTDAMAVQKYDIRRPDSEGGGFEERFWSPVNSPVLGDNKKLLYIIHRVEDVTDYIRMKEQEDEKQKFTEELKSRAEKMESEVFIRARQLKESNQLLRENEEKFQKAFQASGVGIAITLLSDYKYVDVNDAFVNLIGYSKEEIINHTSTDLGFVVDMRKRETILKEIREKGSAKDIEMTLRHKSGKTVEVLSSVETIVLKGEKYTINVVYDITERKRAEVQLASVNKELEAFSYSVSHDLRAPLRAVDGYSRMLEEEYGNTLDEEAKRLLRIIQYNANKMGVLIDDLLTFSRLGKKELQKSNFNMNDLVQGTLNDLNNVIQHQAEIVIGNLHPAKTDYGLMSHVMFNLLSNAVKYSSKTPSPRVEIKSEQQNGSTIYSVKDNGTGFDMQYAHKLFGVFQRLHTSEEYEGTGVGLAIVQRIIHKHGGKVWAEAKKNNGATFYFSIPNE